ncbi:MAG: hypothetical protein MI684_02910, partial [Chlorobiales bacterium]|nr:hypothetical protein [Chlorobiales bacterium]
QALSQYIDKDVEMSTIEKAAANNGYVNIFDVTTRKVTEGITTVHEAVRVLGNIRQSGSAAELN